MTWATNTLKVPDAFQVRHCHNNSLAEYWVWRRKFIEGPPHATEEFTVEQLDAWGYIGLYRKENE